MIITLSDNHERSPCRDNDTGDYLDYRTILNSITITKWFKELVDKYLLKLVNNTLKRFKNLTVSQTMI